MGIMKTIAKGICATVAILTSIMLVMFVILTICWGPFGSGGDSTATSDEDSRFMQICSTKNISLVTPTETQTQIESSIDPHITILKSGQDDIVECEQLSVFGNNNAIQIANSDVEKIMITGYGNSISYSCDADPHIDDYGDYNDVWQRWLT